MPVPQGAYYAEYHGHLVEHLRPVLKELRRTHSKVIFLAGDSSLDNKHWFSRSENAINGYENVLSPPRMKADVCYWLNREAVQRELTDTCCLNTAIEATSLNSRACCSLLDQDQFIRDEITEEDVLVVSVGGNDIALTPTLCTVLNLLLLSWCVPVACLDNCACACPINTRVDGGCCTCGLEGCLAGSLLGWPPTIGYFVDLFKNRVGNYVKRLVSKRKPKKVLVCMIYYLDEEVTGSWADCALSLMCYNSFPYRLQSAIRAMFRLASQRINIPGTEVVAVPLFQVLDGKTSSDYIQRVEPSPEGGRKMASAIMDVVLGADPMLVGMDAAASNQPYGATSVGSPAQKVMGGAE